MDSQNIRRVSKNSCDAVLLTREDLRIEFQTCTSKLHDQVSAFAIPLAEEFRTTLQNYNSILQKELVCLAGTTSQVKDIVSQDFQRVIQNVDELREYVVALRTPADDLRSITKCGGGVGLPASRRPSKVSLSKDERREFSLSPRDEAFSPRLHVPSYDEERRQISEGSSSPKSKQSWFKSSQLEAKLGKVEEKRQVSEGSSEPTRNIAEVIPDPRRARSGTIRSQMTKQHTENELTTIVSTISPTSPRLVSGSSGTKMLKSQKTESMDSAMFQMMSSLSHPNRFKLRKRMDKIVTHPYFDYFVTVLILLNGFMLGLQTDFAARHDSHDEPVEFEVIEILFATLFTGELAMRLYAYRCAFFTVQDRYWNIFDLSIVLFQLIELLLQVIAVGLGFSFNLLRILRLVRVIRVARALRLIGELKTITSSIAGSMKALFWTGVLLFLIIYVVAVAITQLVVVARIRSQEDGESVPPELVEYWGDLPRSVFSLFMSITGGVDWDAVVRPLMENVGTFMAVFYAAYITFTLLAMLNVVTGVFIENVMKEQENESVARQSTQANALFRMLDHDGDGTITWEEFERNLGTKEMEQLFKTIDVDIDRARTFFDLLDLDESGTVTIDEFIDGCLRIWTPTKGFDLRMLRADLNRLARYLYARDIQMQQLDIQMQQLEEKSRIGSDQGSASSCPSPS